MYLYLVKNKKTKKFWRGNINGFTKYGKVWVEFHNLMYSIRLLMGQYRRFQMNPHRKTIKFLKEYFKDCDLICIDMIQHRFYIHDFVWYIEYRLLENNKLIKNKLPAKSNRTKLGLCETCKRI